MKKTIIFVKKAAFTIIPILLPAFIFLSCIESPLEPVAPSYDMQLGIPLMEIIKLAGDFKKDTTWQVNGDGTFSYVNTFAIKKQSVDSITAHPEPDSDKTELGRFSIDTVESPLIAYTAADLGLVVGGLPQTIPPTTFPIGTSYIDNRGQMDYVQIQNGTLTLTVTNNLPVPVNFLNPVILRNAWSSPVNNNLVARFVISDTLLPGTNNIQIGNISGNLVYGMLAIDPIQLYTQGSSIPVTFTSSHNISFLFQSGMILADSAYAKIPSQFIGSNTLSRFVVDDSLTLRRATFKRGSLKVEIDSRIDLKTTTYLQIDELKRDGPNPDFYKTWMFNGIGKMDTTLSIKDYIIQTNQDSLGTVLHYSAYIQVIESMNKRRVNMHDYIQAKVTPSDTLYAQSVTGNFPTRNLDVNSGTKVNYNLGDIDRSQVDSLRFKGLKVKVKLPITAGTTPPPLRYNNLSIVAKNTKYNYSDVFDLGSGNLNPAVETPVIVLNQVQTDDFVNSLIRFYPDLPDSIFIMGQLIINPDFNPSNSYTLQDTSGIYPYVDVNIPSFVGILGAYVSDVQDIKGKISEDMARSMNKGTLNLAFSNGIPLQLTSNIKFLKWNDSIMPHRSDTTLSFYALGPILAAHLNPADSSADAPTSSMVSLSLTTDQALKISRSDSLYFQFNLNSNDGVNNGAMVKIKNDDKIKVNASTIVKFRVNNPK